MVDPQQSQLAGAVIAGVVSLTTALLTVLVTTGVAERKLRRDFRLEFAAERVAHQLMMSSKWQLRSFDKIRRHLGGFEDDDLRKILVRAGGIRFESQSGTELWGLLERNRDRLGLQQITEDSEIEDAKAVDPGT